MQMDIAFVAAKPIAHPSFMYPDLGFWIPRQTLDFSFLNAISCVKTKLFPSTHNLLFSQTNRTPDFELGTWVTKITKPSFLQLPLSEGMKLSSGQ